MAHAVSVASPRLAAVSGRPRPRRERDAPPPPRSMTTRASSSSPFPKRHWGDMTTAEFASCDKTRLIAVLPVGAIEQHGPHLPVCVDAAINAGVLHKALELLPADVPVCVLPAVPYGKSVEHDSFPGTVSLTSATLEAVWRDIGDSLAHSGVEKLVLFNSHGGQPQVMDIVARDLRKRHAMLVVTCSWFSFGLPDELFSGNELKHGLHAGDVETSVMLHLHPELVQMEHSENFKSTGETMERDFSKLAPEGGGVGFGWLAEDLNPAGATGDATNATAEKGKETVAHAAAQFVNLLNEVNTFDAACFFNKKSKGRYCGVSLRRVWNEDDGEQEKKGKEKGQEEEKKNYKSHFAG